MTRNKYGAKKATIDGIEFDSLAEAARYRELTLLQQAGEIEALTVHPRYVIWEGVDSRGKRQRIEYEPDFRYTDSGRTVCEDVKGVKTAVYMLKRKMFTCKYPEIRFVEVGKNEHKNV